MSGEGFSNTSTGSKPADPYKQANLENVSLKQKFDDLGAFIDATKFGMMTTRHGTNGSLVSRAMAVAAKENGGVDLLFHTNTETGKTDDLTSDPHINISFIDSSGQWASISGEASVLTDRETVKKYYSPGLKAWIGDLGDGVHDGGPNDPRIGIIKVKPVSITYAVTSKTILGRAADVAKGAVTGQTPSINSLREITPEEIQQWRNAN